MAEFACRSRVEVPPQLADPGIQSMKNMLVRTALIVLGLTPVLEAATNGDSGSAVFCPPLYQYLTPTLLDALFYPGISFR